MSVQNHIASLPRGLQREFTSAEQRTGTTPALEHAARMLPVLLKMTPEEIERYMAPIYQRTK
jgi:hypothetical protein